MIGVGGLIIMWHKNTIHLLLSGRIMPEELGGALNEGTLADAVG